MGLPKCGYTDFEYYIYLIFMMQHPSKLGLEISCLCPVTKVKEFHSLLGESNHFVLQQFLQNPG